MESEVLAVGCHTPLLPRKEKRKLLKKAKRKQKRQEAAEEAKKQQEDLAKDPAYKQRLLEEQAAEEQRQRVEEEQHRRDEERWLERERVLAAAAAQKEEAARKAESLKPKRQEEVSEKVVQEEDTAGPATNQPTEPERAQDAAESEEEVDNVPEIIWEGNKITVRKRKVKKKKDVPEVAEEDRPTHNPLYPVNLPDTATLLAQAEADADKRELCQFYMRTGACRHFDRCSRKHPYPSPSHVLLIRGMFTGFEPPGVARTEDDASLEHTEDEIHREFEEFYEDALPEFEEHGTVTNFKVCVNTGPHLRGNVYVSYKDKEAAIQAHTATNGRFYGGKQLVCTYAPFTHWRSAICGVQRTTGKCQHGGNCNYLHCFRNSGGAFAQADFEPVDGRHEERPTARRHEARSVDVERSSKAETSGRERRRHGREDRYTRSPSRSSDRRERRGGDDKDWRPSDDRRSRDERSRSDRRKSGERAYERSRSPDDRQGRRRERSKERRSEEESMREETKQQRKRRKEAGRESPEKEERSKRRKGIRESHEGQESRGTSRERRKESGRERRRHHSRERKKSHEETYERWTPEADQGSRENTSREGYRDRDRQHGTGVDGRLEERSERNGSRERDSGRPREKPRKKERVMSEDTERSPKRQRRKRHDMGEMDVEGRNSERSASLPPSKEKFESLTGKSIQEDVILATEALAEDPSLPLESSRANPDTESDKHGSQSRSTVRSLDLEEHLLELRRAVERSFKERTLKFAEPG